jgi:purine-nucleoside phosphorylase
MQQVVFPIRVMAAFDVKTVIVANAVGAINESYKPGDIVAISDHINLMGDNPLQGSNGFVDLSEAYSSELRKLGQAIANRLGITLRSGVYAALSGPTYETPAEVRALRSLGADMVGMSTVPEVIMANRLGMKVLGLSMVTNMAAGMSAEPLSHQKVIEASKNESEKFKTLVKGIIKQLSG